MPSSTHAPKFVNPITQSFRLLADFRELLTNAFQRQGIASDDVLAILAKMDVDKGVRFSTNRTYRAGERSFSQFCADQGMHENVPARFPRLERLHLHQEEAIRSIRAGEATVVATGTGSGKTESFLIPILDHCLQNPGPGVKALIVYPMNALANDQLERLTTHLEGTEITFAAFTSATPENAPKGAVKAAKNLLVSRREIRAAPPDILITNHVMLEWMLLRDRDREVFTGSERSLKFLVLDEVHSYRGNRAAHLACLLRRLRDLIGPQLVQVACSATLGNSAAGTPGYLASLTAADERLGAFVRPLLRVSQYHFVTPQYVSEPSPAAMPLPAFEAGRSYGWQLETDRDEGFRNIAHLVGRSKPYSRFVLTRADGTGVTDSEPYRDLQSNAYVIKLREALARGGATFRQLVDLFRDTAGSLPEGVDAEEVVKSYLSAVAFINHCSGDRPLLDFRLHVFLRNLSGFLKRCLHCDSFHSGRQEYCQECGFPLFHVSKKDLGACLGKVIGNRLRWELRPESDDGGKALYVEIRRQGSPDPVALEFRGVVSLTGEAVVLSPEEGATLQLRPALEQRYTLIEPTLVSLTPSTRDTEYLFSIVQSLLDFQPVEGKKVLGFVDNRSKVSQYGLNLQDAFVSRFFAEFIRQHLAPSAKALTDLHSAWRRQIPGELAPDERAAFEEFDLWLARELSLPADRSALGIQWLTLHGVDGRSEAQSEILNVFLQERAIDKGFLRLPESAQFIHFDRYRAFEKKGIYTSAKESSDDPDHPAISLTTEGDHYGSLVQRLGPPEVLDAVAQLVGAEILTKKTTADGKEHYYLTPDYLTVNLTPSTHDGFRALRETLFLQAGIHSSEVHPDRRRATEAAFRKGDIHCVFATPTLEMGIDIGNLQSVLMVGVPPLPSNYAQRAGRAGRSAGQNYALIVTFCTDGNHHDEHFFQNPEEMIEGMITPPSFEARNAAIVGKHVNAVLLRRWVENGRLTSLSPHEVEDYVREQRPVLDRLFGDILDLDAYLLGAFPEVLASVVRRLPPSLHEPHEVRQWLYNEGYLPDHGFRSDMISLLENQKTGGRPGLPEAVGRDRALSEREPERAFYHFAPGAENGEGRKMGQNLFVGEGVYEIRTPGPDSYTIVEGLTPEVRSYRYLLAVARDRRAGRHAVVLRYTKSVECASEAAITPGDEGLLGGIVGLKFYRQLAIDFVNEGLAAGDETRVFTDSSGETFRLGYRLRRQGLALTFPHEICADPRLWVSLLCALDRAIKDKYGLDEGEIGILTDVVAHPSIADQPRQVLALLYDSTGRGNVSLEALAGDPRPVLEFAFERITACRCRNGCYLCLKSYSTQDYTPHLSKQHAKMFVGYLLGKNPFEPALQASPAEAGPTLVLSANKKGQSVFVRSVASGKEYTEAFLGQGELNATLFRVLGTALRSEYRGGMAGVTIRSNIDYLVNAINGDGKIKSGETEFARLRFELLRFAAVRAEKE